MTIQVLPGAFAVCSIPSVKSADLSAPYTFLSVTDDEVSLVCPSQGVPADALAVEPGWRALKIAGPLEFSMVGVIARIAGLLAAHTISLFVVSTYNTDYILVKAVHLEQAVMALHADGYTVQQ